MLDEKKNNFIALFFRGGAVRPRLRRVSTGEAFVTSFGENMEGAVINELGKFSPGSDRKPRRSQNDRSGRLCERKAFALFETLCGEELAEAAAGRRAAV